VKRALLLTYHVPPRPAIASVRVGHMIRALELLGWSVTPVVPDLGDVEYESPVCTTGVIDFRAPLRKLLGVEKGVTTHAKFNVQPASVYSRPGLAQSAIILGRRVTDYANTRFGWLGPGTRAAEQLMAQSRFDVVVSTSPPEATHLVAARIHADVPWIADLRDPWLRDDELASPFLLRAFDRILEPGALHSASAITTVSEPIAEKLRERYPKKNVQVLRNAFDEREWADVPFVDPQRTTFLYAGQLYGGHRDPRPFFDALAHLLRERIVHHDEVRVDLYCEVEPWLESEVVRFGLRQVVRFPGRRPRSEILRLERAASRLLLFCGNGSDERGTYTAKLFEYFGARRRIIAVGGPQEETVIDEALRETGAGERFRSAHALRDAILEAVVESRAQKTAVIRSEGVRKFEFRYFAERFEQILASCM
jgi:glycosyltransferase involved in cell wall biosynthesis